MDEDAIVKPGQQRRKKQWSDNFDEDDFDADEDEIDNPSKRNRNADDDVELSSSSRLGSSSPENTD